MKNIETHCKSCGAPVDIERKQCPYCGCIYPHINLNDIFTADAQATCVLRKNVITEIYGGKGNQLLITLRE